MVTDILPEEIGLLAVWETKVVKKALGKSLLLEVYFALFNLNKNKLT